MPNVFSRRTLEKFEDASAGIPLRRLDRAFAGADIHLGADPGGPEGTRRTQFRRYVAGVDQDDPEQLDRLGHALGALIEEVAASKVDFLVQAAESDGFLFADGVFRPVTIAASSFTVARVEDLAFIDDRERRLHLLANDSPEETIAGAKELVESVCRTVLSVLGEPAPEKTASLADIAETTLKGIELGPGDIDDAKNVGGVVRRCVEQLGAVVASLDELRKGLSPCHARLAVGAAVTFGRFIAEVYRERAALKKR